MERLGPTGHRAFCHVFNERVTSRDGATRREWCTVEGVGKGRGGCSGERLKTSLSHEEVWVSLGRDGRGGCRCMGRPAARRRRSVAEQCRCKGGVARALVLTGWLLSPSRNRKHYIKFPCLRHNVLDLVETHSLEVKYLFFCQIAGR